MVCIFCLNSTKKYVLIFRTLNISKAFYHTYMHKKRCNQNIYEDRHINQIGIHIST